jgi:hypothetical protein
MRDAGYMMRDARDGFCGNTSASAWACEGNSKEAFPSMAPAFGVRGLDPALAFGGTRAVSRTKFERCIRPSCYDLSTLYINRRERKSGVKPPHSKA